jgi:DNA-binding transcriptional LysR family regulator
MDIRQLKYFLTIAEEEQITGAAKKLHIAQPPLSSQLKALEKELNVKLVDRGSRKIHLTDAGKILRNRAEQIIELTEATVKELEDYSSGIQGTLTLGAVSSSGALLIPNRISKFHEKYPCISFEIWEGNTYRILEILNSGVIEIGIVRTPFNSKNLGAIYLEKEPMVAAIRDDLYLKETKKNINLVELMDKPLIIYRRFENLIIECCTNAGFQPKIICRTDDARTALLWADSGIGIAIIPKSALDLIRSSYLNYRVINEQTLETQIAAIWLKNRHLSSAAKHFIENFK